VAARVRARPLEHCLPALVHGQRRPVPLHGPLQRVGLVGLPGEPRQGLRARGSLGPDLARRQHEHARVAAAGRRALRARAEGHGRELQFRQEQRLG
jgi:hypothetical protein